MTSALKDLIKWVCSARGEYARVRVDHLRELTRAVDSFESHAVGDALTVPTGEETPPANLNTLIGIVRGVREERDRLHARVATHEVELSRARANAVEWADAADRAFPGHHVTTRSIVRLAAELRAQVAALEIHPAFEASVVEPLERTPDDIELASLQADRAYLLDVLATLAARDREIAELRAEIERLKGERDSLHIVTIR